MVAKMSAADRKENIRRVAEVAALFHGQGSVVVCTFVSPYAEDRAFAVALRAFEILSRMDAASRGAPYRLPSDV